MGCVGMLKGMCFTWFKRYRKAQTYLSWSIVAGMCLGGYSWL